jgi:DNA-binding CsgD family transcriptional regulator
MAFIERCSEMGRLSHLYERCGQGKAQIVLMDGAVASGKTELLHVFGEQVVESDGLLLTAAGTRAEPTVPFDILGQLFLNSQLPAEARQAVGALLSEHTGPDAPTASLAAAPGDGAGLSEGPAVRRDVLLRLSRALCDILLALCARQPVVVGVDDVQHADEASLEVLLYLLRRLRSQRLMVVLNEWTAPRPAHPAFRAELLRQPDCHRILLQLLSTAGVMDALGARPTAAPPDRLAPHYHAVSGGNPLLLSGLMEDSTLTRPDGSQALSAEPLPGDSFRQAVFACLYRWDDDAIGAARGLAALGRDAEPALIGRLIGLDAADVRQSLDSLTKSGLLEDGWFRHPTVRNVVMDSLGTQQRARLHLAAARLLHDGGQPAADVARHVIAAGRTGEDWEVAVLRDAAAHGLAEDRLDFALECLELAHRACDDPCQRASLTMTLTRLKWRNQPSAAARHLTPLRQAMFDGHLDAQHGTTLIHYLVWHGRNQEALDTYHWMMDSEAAADPATAADLQLIRSWIEPVRSPDGSAGSVADVAPLGTAAPSAVRTEVARTATDEVDQQLHSGLAGWAAFCSVLTEGPTERAVEQAEQVLAACTLSDDNLLAVRYALHTLISADRPDKAKPWCRIFLGQARARRSTTWEAMLSAIRAEAALREGDLADAEQWGRQALELLAPHNWGVFIGLPLSVLLRAQTGLGHYEDGAETLRQLVPDSLYGTRLATNYLRARGHYYLATRRSRAALADFRRCGELTAAWDMDAPVLVPWRSDSAQAQIRLGEPLEARGLVEEQMRMPGGQSARTRGMSLRVLAQTHELERRPALLREAVDLLGSAGDAMELLLALVDLSRAHRELGDVNMSRMLERRVQRLAKDCGAEERCRSLLGIQSGPQERVGVQPAGVVVLLSEAERRVAELAARGHTNRQISRKLYITVSTVEQHLTRVYRKLHVTRRANLPLWLKEEADHFEPPHLLTADG